MKKIENEIYPVELCLEGWEKTKQLQKITGKKNLRNSEILEILMNTCPSIHFLIKASLLEIIKNGTFPSYPTSKFWEKREKQLDSLFKSITNEYNK